MESRLKTVRKYYGLSQKEFAELLAISRPTVSFIESGKAKPRLGTIRLCSLIFGIDENWLRGIEEGDTDDTQKAC